MGDQNIFNLGEHGVVLTPTPLHTKDGSFARAQNAEFFLDKGKGGIRQRPPLRRLTGTAADAGYGLLPVRLADPFALTLYLQKGHLDEWRVSTDGGATWADASGPTKPMEGHWDKNGGNMYAPISTLRIGRRTFYHYDNLGDDGIAAADRDRGYVLAIGPTLAAAAIRHTTFAQLHGSIYFARETGAVGAWATFRANPATGELSKLALPYIGEDDGVALVSTGVEELPMAMVAHLGKLWLITQASSNGAAGDQKSRVLSARPGDTAWVEERTNLFSATNLEYFSACVYRGELYVASESTGGGGALATIEKRTPAGVWSTVLTAAGFAGAAHAIGGLIVYQDALYAVEYRTGSSSQTMIVHKFDGTSWTQDDTFAAVATTGGLYGPLASTAVIGQALFLNGVFGTRRKLAGAWSALTTGITSTAQYASVMVGV